MMSRRNGIACSLVIAAVLNAGAARAQLDEDCVVSVLNRTARLQSDGSFVLPNVPGNFGQVRARATCVRYGVVTSGESDLFQLGAPGAPIRIPEIHFGPQAPIPSSLDVTAPITDLHAVGETTQLTVTARFSDDSTADYTIPSTGTNYNSSNVGIISVTPGGLVTAVSAGTAVISAMNEGALGIIRLRVVLTGDSDGDGIPDDVEGANGLDPNDPIDALEDPDGDGLTNRAELVDYGTQIRAADTDGDGIRDGEEVVAGADGFVTSPLLADSDGDGLRDGLEVQTSSDPTDPQSVNLAQALASLEVSPSSFTLTVNTIIGQASRKLRVTGHLIDGRTLDLTSTQGVKATNFASNDLLVCNFGAEAGRVFASQDGTCTITVSNSMVVDTAIGTVRTFAPIPVGFVSIPGSATNVDVSGNYAYVSAGSAGLHVVDVSDRAHPTIIATLDTSGDARDVRVVGETAYVADGAAGLVVIDVSDPSAPGQLAVVDTPGVAEDVAVEGNFAYVADNGGDLQVIDLSDPSAPELAGSASFPGTALGVDVEGSLAAVALGTSGVQLLDVSSPTAPALLSSIAGGDVRDVAIAEDLVLVADHATSFRVIDVSNRSAPQASAPEDPNLAGRLVDVVSSGRFALGADIFFVNDVPIIDVSNAADPIPRALLPFRSFRDDDGTGIAVDGSHVYLTAVRGDSRLYIGKYLEIEDLAEIPPQVAIVSPVNGETLIEGSELPIVADATDDVGVAAVAFQVDGALVATDTSEPYETSVSVPPGAGGLEVHAEAVDFGSNVGVSESVQVSVIPDPLTTVVGSVEDAAGDPVPGATIEVRGLFVFSDGSGAFRVEAVPTTVATLRATASAAIGGETARGTSGSLAPVRGGITNVGAIRIQSVPSAGLRGYWPFNANANDESGAGNNGTVSGALLTADRFEVSGSAYLFDGVNDRISVPDSDSLDFLGPITISAWVRPTLIQSSGDRMIVGKSNYTTTTNYLIRVRGGGSARWEYSGYSDALSHPLVANVWQHVVVTATGPTGAKKVFIDGVERSVTSVSSSGAHGAVSNPMTIGGTSGGAEHFQGTIDDMRIYDRALSAGEVNALFSEIPESTITSISPASGAATGEAAVTIRGTGFDASTTVTIGGVPLGSPVVVDGTTVRGTAPPGAIGAADVVASTAFGTAVLQGGFTYADAVGDRSDNPALSCLDVAQRGAIAGSGKYWIQVPSGIRQMHCDFVTAGGGWTRVGALDDTQNYCGTSGATDMLANPDASAGKIPDADVQALMTQTVGSPLDVLFFVRTDGRWIWHDLAAAGDFVTSSRHTSGSFYCTNWHCDNGSTDNTVCGTEGNGCPVTGMGTGGFTKKVYVDLSFGSHNQAFHTNGNMCALPNYTNASIWVYVR